MKASELKKSRNGPKMIPNYIDKLAALREEVRKLSGSMIPVMMVIDTAEEDERMRGLGPKLIPESLSINYGFHYTKTETVPVR